ncbi:MAG TPA: sigma-70 family RNA polymerase sigma factor [Solirubrobacterales bacterium]
MADRTGIDTAPVAGEDADSSTWDRESAEHLATAVRRGRGADRKVAAALRRPAPAGKTADADYLGELGRRPVLPQAEERELIDAARRGDGAARARLVEAFMPLIGSVARLYRDSPQIRRVELLQEGVVGLLRALERYDPTYGGPFWPYAVWWVRQAMQQLVAELSRPIVLSDRALRQLARVGEAHREALAQEGVEPGIEQLAAATDLDPRQVGQLLAASRPARSTEAPLVAEESEVGTLGELLADPLAEDEYERVLEAMEGEKLLSLLAILSDREREILAARHGLDGREPETLREIGGRLGLSAERVRQIERRALGKLAAAGGS